VSVRHDRENSKEDYSCYRGWLWVRGEDGRKVSLPHVGVGKYFLSLSSLTEERVRLRRG